MSALFEKEFTFTKFDREKGIAYGFAIVSTENGQPYWDLHGDHIPEDSMTVAATEFMMNHRVGKDQHQGDQVGDIVFGFPLTKSFVDGEGMTTRKTGFMIGYQPHDPVHFDMIASGERTGFSMGGFLLDHETTDIGKAVWSRAFVDALPDSSFLWVENGKKDKEGKTTPRSLRHYPVKNAKGEVDAAHVRNALARVANSELPDDARLAARKAGEGLLASLSLAKSADLRPDGAKRGRVFRSFVIREISLVDRPAQEGATVATVKHVIARVPDAIIAKRVVLTSNESGHQHVVYTDITDDGDYGCTSYDYSGNDDTGHTHKVLVLDGVLTISANGGHVHTVTMPDGWLPKVPAPPMSADTGATEVQYVDTKSSSEKSTEENAAQDARARADLTTGSASGSVTSEMSEATKMTEAEITALRDQLARAEKRADRAEQIAGMSPTMQTFFGKLAGNDQTSFIAKSVKDRQADVDAAIVHKSADGTVYFTFDDRRMVDLAKSLEASEKRNAENETRARAAEFAKQASEDLGFLKGEQTVHVALISAIASIGDEALRKACFETIRSGNAAAAVLTKSNGHSLVDGIGGSQPKTGEVAYYAKRDEWAKKSNIDLSTDFAKAKATKDFNKTAEGAAAYAALNNGQA